MNDYLNLWWINEDNAMDHYDDTVLENYEWEYVDDCGDEVD